jgi:hypothetical protein
VQPGPLRFELSLIPFRMETIVDIRMYFFFCHLLLHRGQWDIAPLEVSPLSFCVRIDARMVIRHDGLVVPDRVVCGSGCCHCCCSVRPPNKTNKTPLPYEIFCDKRFWQQPGRQANLSQADRENTEQQIVTQKKSARPLLCMNLDKRSLVHRRLDRKQEQSICCCFGRDARRCIYHAP